jgi:drug/metabolite transporter (DMT)-like permease
MARIVPGSAARDRRWLALLALLVAIGGIAWSAIFIRWAAVPGASSAFYRVVIAALVLVPWRLATLGRARSASKLPVRRTTRRGVLLALAGGAFFGMDLALYNTAVMRTTATTATLLGNNAPIFVGIGSWLFFKQRPKRRFWFGLALAMSGAAVVMMSALRAAGAQSSSASGSLSGDFMALAAAVFFAGYLLTTEHVREEMDTLTFSTIAVVGSIATLLAVCLAIDAPLGGFSGRTWSALLGLGLISQLGAYLGLAYALGHLPATVTSVGLLAQVPLTALLAVPLLGEPLTAPLLAGGALVLTGIYVVNSGSTASSHDD